MPRATVEADLIRALTEDIDDLHVDLVDLKLRRKIDHLMAKLSAED